MSVVNRRNVALGLAAYKLTKNLKRLRREPEPEPEPPKKRRGRKIGALVVGAAAVAGAVAFLRSR